MKHFDDLTMIDVPFGELDKDTRDRLRECEVLEWYSRIGKIWFNEKYPELQDTVVYRKPKPTPMTRQQVLEKYNVVVTEDRKG